VIPEAPAFPYSGRCETGVRAAWRAPLVLRAARVVPLPAGSLSLGLRRVTECVHWTRRHPNPVG